MPFKATIHNCEFVSEACDGITIISSILRMIIRLTNLNLLEGTVNHGDEHVQQHYHHGDVVDAVQHVTDIFNKFVSIVDDDRPDLRQSKYSPEQCFEALLQAKWMHREGNGGGRGRSYFQTNH